MATRLIDCLAETKALSEIFSDRHILQTMLGFEASLARVEGQLGLIPQDAATAIAEAAVPENFDIHKLADAALRAGTPAIPLVDALRKRTGRYAHWGATSQDVVDTTLVILLGECREVFARDQRRLSSGLEKLSNEHAAAAMLGRTLLQPAPPITFGLKAAGWLAAIRRGWSRVDSRFAETAYLQFGGPSGTLALLGDRGLEVSQALAAELGLKCPDAPWHAHRDRLGAAMAALSIYVASLGKMALDVSLLMQHEVGEASEPAGQGRGGSSSIPGKHNPTACMLAIAAAKRTPGLMANFLNGMLVEHERALGGWQSEWTTVAAMVQSAGVALESMVEVAEGLRVDTARMRANLDAGPNAGAKRGSAEIFRQRLLKGD